MTRIQSVKVYEYKKWYDAIMERKLIYSTPNCFWLNEDKNLFKKKFYYKKVSEHSVTMFEYIEVYRYNSILLIEIEIKIYDLIFTYPIEEKLKLKFGKFGKSDLITCINWRGTDYIL